MISIELATRGPFGHSTRSDPYKADATADDPLFNVRWRRAAEFPAEGEGGHARVPEGHEYSATAAYCRVITSLAKENNQDEASRWLRAMHDKGLECSVHTYNTLLNTSVFLNDGGKFFPGG